MKNKIFMVALFGPDGSGKSTVADLLEKQLYEDDIQVLRHHWRPRFLPSLKKNYSTPAFNDPSGLQVRGLIMSLVCYLYFFLDFLVATRSDFGPSTPTNTIVLYERYFYDVLIHPQRYKLKKMSWLGRKLSQLLRTPDLTFLLTGTPAIIRARKPELTVEEIDRQIKILTHEIPFYAESTIFNTDLYSAADLASVIANEIKLKSRPRHR
jgi:thymidylate kinase